MGLSVVTYALSKSYTDKSLIGMGALKGAPCKVKSVEKVDKQNVITLEWKDDLGATHTTEVYVEDGNSVDVWNAGQEYEYGELVIYSSCLYRCLVPNNDMTFVESKWQQIGASSEGTAVIINGVNKTGDIVSFYAPLTSGTEGQVLVSQGENTPPKWATIQTTNEGYSPSFLDNALVFTMGVIPAVSGNTITFDLGNNG